MKSTQQVLLPACILSALLLSSTAPFIQRSNAQTGGGIGLGQQDLFRQVRKAAKAMRKYRCKIGHMPRFSNELDDALKMAFKEVAMTKPNPNITPQSEGVYRIFYQFRIAYDPSIRGIPVINGRVTPPSQWSAPANSIVMVSDGEDMYAVWAAADDMRPINDPTTNNPLVILEAVKCDDSSNNPAP